MERIQRIRKVDPATFPAQYIAGSQPVIVTDGMEKWAAPQKWTPKYFRERFGDLYTQVYDDLFTLQGVFPLSNYIDECLDKQGRDSRGAYVRWYVKFKDVEFCWSDKVFKELAEDWSHPYFLPTSSYVMPLCRPPHTIPCHTGTYPYKGLFISAQGARTRLHRDPFGTDAVLCQFYGIKSLKFYHPADDGKLRRGKEFVDPQNPNGSVFPEFSVATPAYIDELKPGEILFTPSGWFHDVLSVTDSISVTWNFVHATNREPFLREIDDPSNDFDRDMLDFFFSRGGKRTVSVSEMRRLAMSV
jgi:hypothetical protein